MGPRGARTRIDDRGLTARDPLAMRAVLVAHLNHKRDVVIEQLRAAMRQLRRTREGLIPMNAPLPRKRHQTSSARNYEQTARASNEVAGELAAPVHPNPG
jgi:hypothetical protein